MKSISDFVKNSLPFISCILIGSMTSALVAAESFDYEKPLVRTVESHGSPTSKVDLVFVSDGYTTFEKDKFQDDIQATCRYLWGTEFYGDNRSNFNVHSCFVPAHQTARGVEFPFGSVYVEEAVGYMKLTREAEAQKVAQKAPGCDFVIVLSTLSGVSHGGAQVIVLAGRNIGAFPHELGHSLGLLGDEYNSTTRQADREKFPLPARGDLDYPNLTLATCCDPSTPERMAKTVKWSHLFSLPDAKEVLGTYLGGYYRGDGVYRPSYRCVMRDSADSKFCPVCHEALSRRIAAVCGFPFDHEAYHRRYPLKLWKYQLNY